MGLKSKWIKNSKEQLISHLLKLENIFSPHYQSNGELSFSDEDSSDMAYLLALIMNCYLVSNEDKYFRSFGADDVYPVKISSDGQSIVNYWGCINWLATPNDHVCYRSFKDPFYAEFRISDDGLLILNCVFGDYDKTDLESIWWNSNSINWMYDLI